MDKLDLPEVTLDYKSVMVMFNYTMTYAPSHDQLMRIKAYLEAAYDDLNVTYVDVRKVSGYSWTDATFAVSFTLNSKDA